MRYAKLIQGTDQRNRVFVQSQVDQCEAEIAAWLMSPRSGGFEQWLADGLTLAEKLDPDGESAWLNMLKLAQCGYNRLILAAWAEKKEMGL